MVDIVEFKDSFVRARDPSMKSEIQRCIDNALDGSNMVKNANQIMEKLRSLGLMQRMQLHPKMVGIHPRNRDGAGVSPQEVHCLLGDIIDHGFVKSKVEAVGIEIEDDEHDNGTTVSSHRLAAPFASQTLSKSKR